MAVEIRFTPQDDITAYELSEFVITPDGVGGGGGGSATANGPDSYVHEVCPYCDRPQEEE